MGMPVPPALQPVEKEETSWLKNLLKNLLATAPEKTGTEASQLVEVKSLPDG